MSLYLFGPWGRDICREGQDRGRDGWGQGEGGGGGEGGEEDAQQHVLVWSHLPCGMCMCNLHSL